MPYNFVANIFHTKKLCSRLSSSKVRFYVEIGPFCVFEPPFQLALDEHRTLTLRPPKGGSKTQSIQNLNNKL